MQRHQIFIFLILPNGHFHGTFGLMKAWPFLISSSPHSDFRVVVAPEFITKADAVREIIRASNDSFRTEDGQAIYLRGFHEKTGPINIVLRAKTGTARLLGGKDDQPLVDGFGRPVWVSEGIVLREEGKEPFTAAQLDAALERAQPHFARFWEDKDSRKWEPVPMDPFPLPAAEGEALAITYKQSPTLPQAATTAALTAPRAVSPQIGAASAPPSTPPNSLLEGKGRAALMFGLVASVVVGATYLAHRFAVTRKEKRSFAEEEMRRREAPASMGRA